jgi:hypothetical protein
LIQRVEWLITTASMQVSYITSRFKVIEDGRPERTDVLASLDLPERNKGLSGPVESLRDGSRCLGLSFRSDDCCLTFLFGLKNRAEVQSERLWEVCDREFAFAHLLNDELGPLSVLLSDLLLFDGGGELLSETE